MAFIPYKTQLFFQEPEALLNNHWEQKGFRLLKLNA